MADITISVPDNLLDELVDANDIWAADAKALDPEYDSRTSAEKLEMLILASLKIRAQNLRREKAERQARKTIPEVPLQRRRRNG